MAQQVIVQVSRIGRAVWESYKSAGDFAVFDPNNPDADASGMFHVKLSDYEVVDEVQHKSETNNPSAAGVTIKLRRLNVDDQGRS